MSDDGCICRTNTATFETHVVKWIQNPPQPFCATRDGRTLFFGDGLAIKQYDTVTRRGKTLGYTGDDWHFFDIELSPSERYLAFGQYTVYVKKTSSNSDASEFVGPGYGSWVNDMAFSEDDKYLAAATLSGVTEVWKTSSGHLVMSSKKRKSIERVKWFGKYLEVLASARTKLGQKGDDLYVFLPPYSKPIRVVPLPEDDVVFIDWLTSTKLVILYADGRVAIQSFSL
jgi:WD40 repeat protein